MIQVLIMECFPSVCLSETEHSSEESSCEHVGATGGSQVHKRHGKRPHKHSFLSSLGSCSEYNIYMYV